MCVLKLLFVKELQKDDLSIADKEQFWRTVMIKSKTDKIYCQSWLPSHSAHASLHNLVFKLMFQFEIMPKKFLKMIPTDFRLLYANTQPLIETEWCYMKLGEGI